MADRTCPKCQKAFSMPCHLKRHLARKTPCDPIVEPRPQAGLPCRYCGRTYTTKQALSRHLHHRCKIANSEEGMDKLMEHTLQRQLREQNAKIDELTTLVKQMATGVPAAGAVVAAGALAAAGAPAGSLVTQMAAAGQVQQAQQITNVQQNIGQVVNIVPWDGDRRIVVDVAQIAAAFAENARLREYARLGDHELVDPEIAPPYVTDLLVDLTKRAHADPAARNVYLNPRRADQALAHMQGGKWEVLPLMEATRLMFDGVVASIHKVSRTNAELRQLPTEAQNAMSMAGMVYEDEPDEYAKRAKGPIAAHLQNMAPSQAITG